MLQINLLVLLLLALVCQSLSSNQIQRSIPSKKRTNQTSLFSLRDHYKNCDSLIKNRRHGFITSPLFPNAFPLPIYCRWLIDLSSFTAKSDNQTLVVYLNEVYVKRGLKFTEYSFFLDENLNIDGKQLQPVHFNSNQSFIFTKRKYLVVQFQIDEKISPNLHARVLNSPANFYGFNLTFELTNRTVVTADEQRQTGALDSREVCSFKKCNFNGRCINRIQDGLFKFDCECFDNYHGEYCEFGPDCDPFKANSNVNDCLNGGSCIYSSELVRIKCKCPENYSGEYCERPRLNSQFNVTDNCAYIVKVKSYNLNYEQRRTNDPADNFEVRFRQMVGSLLRQYDRNLYIQDIKLSPNGIIEIHLFYQVDNGEFIKNIFTNEISKGSLGRFLLDKSFLEITIRPAFTITEVQIENAANLNEGDNVTIHCLVNGITSPVNASWFKDDEPINLTSPFRAFRHKISFPTSSSTMKSSLTISNSTYSDSGAFTCVVASDNYQLKRTVNLQLSTLQEPKLSPLSMTVKSGQSVSVDCYTNTKDYNLDSINRDSRAGLVFGYNWLRNDRLVNQLEGHEIVQDLHPTGSRITVLNVSKPLKYKCILTSLLGTASKEIFVDVMEHAISEGNYCKTDFKDGIEWKQSIMNTEFVHKCPDGYVGEARRRCLYLDHQKPASWSPVDYSDCLSVDFERLFRRASNFFLGYGNSSYERLIDEIVAKIKVHPFKTGEGEAVVKLLEENNRNLFRNRGHFKAAEYERVLTKLLDMLSYLLDSKQAIYNLMAKDNFQSLALNFSNQLIEAGRNQRSNLKNYREFKNFVLFFVENPKSLRSQTVYLPLKSNTNSSRFTFSNLHPGDKMLFLLYKVNHFWLNNNDFGHKFDGWNKKKSDDNVIYLAFDFFSRQYSEESTTMEIDFDEPFSNCLVATFDNGKLVATARRPEKCHFKFQTFKQPRVLFFMDGGEKHRSGGNRDEQLTFLKGNNKTAFNIITAISCSIILFAMVLNRNKIWRSNNCLASVLKLQLCISLIINQFSTAMAFLSSNQKNENYWLILFTLSQISALTIQFCICIEIEHNFDGSKSHFAKSYRITIVSTIVPFSLIGLIYEFYYTSYSHSLWTLEIGSTLFYSIMLITLLITLGNLFFYIKLSTKLQPFKKENTLVVKSNKYESTSKALTQTIVVTILLNIHLALVLLIINMSPDAQRVLIFAYGICSFMIAFIILFSFRSGMTKFKNISKRCSTENLSLNRQRKAFKHYSSSNSSSLFNSHDIQSIFN